MIPYGLLLSHPLKAFVDFSYVDLLGDCSVSIGWFSWTKVHPLEEHSLPSFFNGKSQNRTPAVYMDIRNLIVRKFHSNPDSQIELKDLPHLEVGDSDGRREVLEFLDYWGLINFHPFPTSQSSGAENDCKGADKKDVLVEKLYKFDKMQPPPAASPTNSLSTQQVSSGLFSETLMADELSKSEGPSVEYHCNSCSADCSRKRYHCQKQVGSFLFLGYSPAQNG